MRLGCVLNTKQVQSSDLRFHSPVREMAREGQSRSQAVQKISSLEDLEHRIVTRDLPRMGNKNFRPQKHSPIQSIGENSKVLKGAESPNKGQGTLLCFNCLFYAGHSVVSVAEQTRSMV